ncbi:MAG TPA: CDP-alcohol phosphatidyltransferase family protein [Ilumatobacteraceae bacterium]|nr:CDP-alcohol phosphatidyltransferase family protein [Ilumatobacteraceae bacterium]
MSKAGCSAAVFDERLRPVKDRLLAPLARDVVGSAPPLALTAVSLAAALGAAVAAWRQLALVAVILWLLSRLIDGLDGAVARHQGTASDRGGLVDIVADTVGYALIPIGIAAGLDTRTAWITVALLLASFYVNAVSWTYLAALLEKRAQGSSRTGAPTSTIMPRGLVEGTETIVFFTVALAWSGGATRVLAVMAAAVAVTTVERLWWARTVLV